VSRFEQAQPLFREHLTVPISVYELPNTT
jgi:hypothetical protein